MLEDIYEVMQQLEVDEVATFTCRNFFNLPKLDLKNVDVSTLVLSNDSLKIQMTNLQEENTEMKNDRQCYDK